MKTPENILFNQAARAGWVIVKGITVLTPNGAIVAAGVSENELREMVAARVAAQRRRERRFRRRAAALGFRLVVTRGKRLPRYQLWGPPGAPAEAETLDKLAAAVFLQPSR